MKSGIVAAALDSASRLLGHEHRRAVDSWRSLIRIGKRYSRRNGTLELERERLQRRGQLSGVHWLVIVLSLTLTGAAWYSVQSAQAARAEQRFNSEASLVIDLFTDRLRRYADVLSATVATIVAKQGRMSPDEWRRYANRLDVLEEFPATSGIAVVQYVPSEKLPDFLARQRKLNARYRLFSALAGTTAETATATPFHLPVNLVAPQWLEAQLTGFDLASDENRRRAVLRAAYLNEIQITAPIATETDGQLAFLMAAPFYKGGEDPAWHGRRDAFAGAIVASVRSEDLRSEVLTRNRPLVEVSVYDNGELIIPGSRRNIANTDPAPLFVRTESVSQYGRQWQFQLESTMAFRDAVDNNTPLVVLIGALAIDMLLLLLFLSVTKGKREALAFADYATSQLRQRSNELEKANEELDQFAHIVSHDLKAPLNGIRLLTSYVEDELEACSELAGARAAIERDLARIRQQVAHSHRLIEGILDYSGVGARQESLEHVDTQALVREIGETLQIEPDALQSIGELPRLYTDRTRLQQVLANLIGNAFKYHHDRPKAQVKVSVASAGEYYRFKVADNGPGIDQKFHQRIFRPFESLQSNSLIESSGIGLAIVKKSVELYGGRISLASAPGRGAEFSFDWPVAIDEDGNPYGFCNPAKAA